MITKQKFKTIDVTDAARIKELLDKTSSEIEICDNSVGNIYMWMATLDTEFALSDSLCVGEHYEGNTYFALRKNENTSEDYISRVKALIRDFGTPLYLCSMTTQETDALEKEFGAGFSFEGEDGAADYIYNAEELREYRGKKFHSQKNHVNAFKKAFENYSFLPYKNEDKDELIAFLNTYEEGIGEMSPSAKKESLACRRLIDMLEFLGLDTRILKIDGEIAGFTVMERIGDTLMIHIEKALTKYRGVYQMLVTLEANAYPDVKYINREEDDGNEGLRRSKMSYNPSAIIQKYIGIIE